MSFSRVGGIVVESVDLLGDLLGAVGVPILKRAASLFADGGDVIAIEPISAERGACALIHKMLSRRTLRLVIRIPSRGPRGGDLGIFAGHGQGVGAEAVGDRVAATWLFLRAFSDRSSAGRFFDSARCADRG